MPFSHCLRMLILFNFYANYYNIIQKVQKDSDFKDTFLFGKTNFCVFKKFQENLKVHFVGIFLKVIWTGVELFKISDFDYFIIDLIFNHFGYWIFCTNVCPFTTKLHHFKSLKRLHWRGIFILQSFSKWWSYIMIIIFSIKVFAPHQESIKNLKNKNSFISVFV